jgi:NAD(P)-dependent dehydrogenase (short-subunit alcohol dehydrogenase family)
MTDRFSGASALVTGGGSGIGAALTHALVAAGANVLCTDIDEAAAERVSEVAHGPGRATPVYLDVTDADAVRAAVDRVRAESGRLDLLFNNAGVVYGGETELLTLDQWNHIIDVNLRGVVHGIVAAYPHMVAEQRGYIVNTASMGGLMAAGLITSYVATKHAVVGLSLALRTEALAHGVGVTVVCPSAVDTPILDKGAIGAFDGRDYYLAGQHIRRPYSPDRLARDVLAAVSHNRAMVVAPRSARMSWLAGRLAPKTVQRMGTRYIAQQRARMQARAGS